jgi:sialidase-1
MPERVGKNSSSPCTRRHWAPNKDDSLWRWNAASTDAGQTWQDPRRPSIRPDGNTDSTYGLMGSLVRLPILGREILPFSNIVSDKGRKNGHVRASFDGGKSWPVRHQIFAGNFACSTLNAGRPGTPSVGFLWLGPDIGHG